MDEDDEQQTISACPLTVWDFVLPFVHIIGAVGQGIHDASRGLHSSMIAHSIYKTDQKMSKDDRVDDQRRMRETAQELERLDASAFEKED